MTIGPTNKSSRTPPESNQGTSFAEPDGPGPACEGWFTLLVAHETGVYGVLGLLSALNEIPALDVRRVETIRDQGVTSVTLFLRSPQFLKGTLHALTGVKSVIWPEEVGSSDEYSPDHHPFAVVQVH